MFSLSDTPPQGVQNNTVTIRIGFSVVYVQFICNTSVGAEGTKQHCHNQDKVQCGLCLVYLTHLGRGRGYKTRLSQSGQGLVWFMFSLSATPRQGQRVQNKTVTIRIRFSVVQVQFILHTQAGAGGTTQHCHNQNRVQCGLCLVYLTQLDRGYKTRLSQSGQGLVWFMFSLSYTPRQGQGVQNKTVTIRIGFSVVYVQFISNTQAGQGVRNKTVTIRIGFSVVYVQFI